MKKIFILLLIACCAGQSTFAQSKKKNRTKPYYVVIDDGSFTNSKSDRGSKLTGYYEKDSLVEMVAWIGFASGDINREFFYWHNNLIMVKETHRLYNPETSTDIDSIKPSFNARYVFTNDKLTDIKQKGTFSFVEMPSDKATQEATYLSMAVQYSGALEKARANKDNRIKLKKKDLPKTEE
ncbi:MAG: hypothetical protein KBF51_12660 [Chitinophagales bacterium]|nr:hypothetical protein [Chitinophagales bacterium]